MRAKIFTSLLLVALSTAAHADDAATSDYCADPSYIIRTPITTSNKEVRNIDVLTDKEKSDPQAYQKLAATPGPYGHSELGYRYLARLFGYTGDFNSPHAVDEWLFEEENTAYPSKKGLAGVWNQWVVTPKKRLSVPAGAYADLPKTFDPNIFFQSASDRARHERCLKTEVAALYCENSIAPQKLEESDVVYFGNTKSTSACTVHQPPWREKVKAAMTNHWTQNHDPDRSPASTASSSNFSAKPSGTNQSAK